jgi:hypothetical protein
MPTSPSFLTIMKSPRSAILLSLVVAGACARHEGSIGSLVTGNPPQFETRTDVATNSVNHSDFYVGDLDGDGTLDMAVVSLTGELRVLIGDGTNFTVAQELQIGGAPIWMSGGDFDGDGDQDIVILRSAESSSDVWLNDGNGTFSQGPALAVPAGPLAVLVGDLNGDSFLDVVVSVPTYPEIHAFFGNGAGAFPTEQQIGMPGGGSAFNLQIGDVTRDGIADLLVADPASDRLLVWPGVAGGSPGATFCELQIPGAPAAVALGELSGDGLVDMCVTTFDSHRFVVVTDILQGGGKGSFGPLGAGPSGEVCDYLSFEVQVPDRPTIATIADVTGDGLADLVACLAFRNSLLVFPQLARRRRRRGELLRFERQPAAAVRRRLRPQRRERRVRAVGSRRSRQPVVRRRRWQAARRAQLRHRPGGGVVDGRRRLRRRRRCRGDRRR